MPVGSDNPGCQPGILIYLRCVMKHEIDVELIAETLRGRGHAVGHIIPVPDNAGEYEFEVDGTLLSLTEARALLERDASDIFSPALPHDPNLVEPEIG
jgi:hypothetical protein